MAETKTGTIALQGVDFAELAKQVIAEKVTEALTIGSGEAVRGLILGALTEQVGTDGVRSTYSSQNTVPWVQWVAADAIRKLTKQVVAERIGVLRPALEKQIEASLRANVKSMASQLAAAAAERIGRDWTTNVDVSFKPRGRD